jgi:hypothetical protein
MVNPRLIGNTFQWVRSAYAIKKPPEDIDRVAMNMAKTIHSLFTKSFNKSPSRTIREELLFVNRYLETVFIKYYGRYGYERPNDSTIRRFGDYRVIPVQLQVHTKNTIEHGRKLGHAYFYRTTNTT